MTGFYRPSQRNEQRMRRFMSISGASLTTAAGNTNYYDAVMADTPWGYWRLDEGSGTVANDISGNSRALSAQLDFLSTSSAGLLVSNTNKGVFLPSTAAGGHSGFVRSPIPAMPSTSVPFTVECLIKPTAAPPETAGAIVCMGTSSGCLEADVIDIGGGSFRIRVMKKGTAVLFTTAGSWTYGTKLHVAIRRGASNVISVVVNGVADANTGTNAYIDYSSETLTFGYGVFSGDQYHHLGNMDELALYNYALTDARLLAHYNASL